MTMDDDSTEHLVSRLPVRVRRRVAWGECDPAQVVYTPRFVDYLVSAFGWFVKVVLNADAPTLLDAGLGTPMKGLELEFRQTLRPNQFFEMAVLVTELRQRTFDVAITARNTQDETVFIGRLSPIFIDRATFTSVAIPEPFASRIRQYRIDALDN